MFSLVYVSDEEVAFERSSLGELARRCSVRNGANGVTGYLSWQGGSFLQFLEGEEGTVRELMRAIESDRRHAVGRVVELSLWDERLFADWGMCFAEPPPPSRARLQQEVESVMRALWAPDTGGEDDAPRIGAMLERVAALVRENDRAAD